MKVFVLGSNSFAGSSFIDYCLDKNTEVYGISRSEENADCLLAYSKSKHRNNFTFRKADINDDLESIIEWIEQIRPDYIADFAGQGMVAPSWQWPWQWYQTNVVSKSKLIHKLKDFDFIKCYLRISTPEVYGSTDGEVMEDVEFNPSTPYAVSHAAQDMNLKAYQKQFNFPVVFTRTANFYGPYQQLYRIIPRTIIYAKLGHKLPLHGGGHSVRSFIFNKDFCDAMFLSMTKGSPGSTYHIANSEYVSIRNLVEKICTKMNIDFDEFVEITEDRRGKDKGYYLNTLKTRDDLGWESKISLDAGVEETVDWIDANWNEIKEMPLEYIHKK